VCMDVCVGQLGNDGHVCEIYVCMYVFT
jgi:hypothetical protein